MSAVAGRARPFVAALSALALSALVLGPPAAAQQPGGTLRMPLDDTPPSPSLHEEITVYVSVPFMPVFNNLVLYDQAVPQNSFDSIRPELATEWKTSDDGLQLAFKLRQGVKWHDGKPFTSADVRCTFDLLMGRGEPKLRRNPRAVWYENIDKVEVDGDFAVTLHLKRPQPSMIALLAAGFSAMYPCHVSPAQMRRHPIGTGPFKFVEMKTKESVRLAKNPDYWRPGRPYLDAIEFSIIPDRSTRSLAFIAGRVDMTFPNELSVPLLKSVQKEHPAAQCTLRPTGVTYNLVVNRDAPPFDDARIRSALVHTIDRKAFIDILSEGSDLVGGAMMPPPAGIWGVGADGLKDLPGYGGEDIETLRERGRALMREAGYGPDKRLRIKVGTRNMGSYRDRAVIMIDQLRHIYIDAELEVIDSAVYFNRLYQKNFTLVVNATGSSIDDPDQHYAENYGCGSLRNFNGYCSKEVTDLIAAQSKEPDLAKRRALVAQIERRLAQDIARPILSHVVAAACWQPKVKGVTIMVNSQYNGWRFEDVWMEK